jgi:cytoskeletal protein RodZ
LSKLTRLVLYVFYFLAVIALGAVIVMSFTSKHTTKIPKASHATAQATSSTRTASQPRNQNKFTAPIQKTHNTTGTAMPATSSSLENTGPGNVVYLFIAASAVGYLVYRSILVRKLD